MLTCCCFMRLEIAGYVIGVLGAAGSLVLIILLPIFIKAVNHMSREELKEMFDSPHIRVWMVELGLNILMGAMILLLVSSIWMVFGILKKRRSFLMPWLIVSGICIFFTIQYNINVWIKLIGREESFAHALPTFIYTLLLQALEVYVYYAIFSLYKQMLGPEPEDHLTVIYHRAK